MTTTKTVQIFRVGRHTAADGRKLNFTDADLQACVDAYDPALHEAPAVVGHPSHNLPAYGWATGLSLKDGVLSANLDQVDPAFAELVTAGRFKKISASFYAPDSDANPKPGAYYLRHIGFLGAQPPAVKGLKSAEFTDGENGVVDFADVAWTWPVRTMARIAQAFREYIIAEKGTDAADKVVSTWDIQSMEDAAVRADAQANPTYSEKPDNEEVDAVKVAELEQREAAATTRHAELEAREEEIRRKEAEFAEREAADRKTADAALIDTLVSEGRLVPSAKPGLLQFMAQLGAKDVVEFSEGAVKQTPRDYFRDLLSKAGTVVNFGEVTPREEETAPLPADPALQGAEIAKRAVSFMEAEAKEGRTVALEAAVAHIRKTTESK